MNLRFSLAMLGLLLPCLGACAVDGTQAADPNAQDDEAALGYGGLPFVPQVPCDKLDRPEKVAQFYLNGGPTMVRFPGGPSLYRNLQCPLHTVDFSYPSHPDGLYISADLSAAATYADCKLAGVTYQVWSKPVSPTAAFVPVSARTTVHGRMTPSINGKPARCVFPITHVATSAPEGDIVRVAVNAFAGPRGAPVVVASSPQPAQ